ncbi:NmrA-like protein [Zopfia rhizophila CBS 207.26]|uniref:NmrA-like protein n=1 Tax=Zopfia rhizophila CBS 207.26 TaxID=1314779 RepID=A0A6A6ESE9_9PEZI|nr:NmrA-like protein [Zopfia rhizophila CBS 207.26]
MGFIGGSVVDHIFQRRSNEYAIRALTRNPESNTAKALTKYGGEAIYADLDDVTSLKAAFYVTDFWTLFGKIGMKKATVLETQQGKNMVDAAAEISTLEHDFWSTLADARRMSNGEHHIPHYESKATVNKYIKETRPNPVC